MRTTMLCQGCLEQMRMPIAIRGPFSPLYRAFGITRSQMHPNLCTMCESKFTQVKKQKQVEVPATIMFADLRGYTRLSQSIDAPHLNGLLHTFYDRCSAAIWERDGVVNKFIGDAVLAIFNFPMERADHPLRAVEAAIDLQRRCRELQKAIPADQGDGFGVGVGIHTGLCNIGEVGNAYRDFTAIGPVVNLASRLQGAAQPGEILLTQEVFDQVGTHFPGLAQRMLTRKGIERPVMSHAINERVLEDIAI